MSDEQLLEITPNRELVFHGFFTNGAEGFFELKNPTDVRIAFIFKATAPQYYTVSPSVGILQPGETKTVTIKIKPTEKTPWDAANHKFVVQSCVRAWYDWILFKAGLNWKKYYYTNLTVRFSEGSESKDVLFSTWKEDDHCAQEGESAEDLNEQPR